MMNRLLPFLLVGGLLLPPLSFGQSETRLPVTKVVFFKSGVSFVEHSGQVQGRSTVTLRFDEEQMKDVLKSLVLQDRGGRVGTITYPSQDPLSKRLQGFQVNLSTPEGLGSLVNQIRGTTLSLVTGRGPVQGTAFSAETRPAGDGNTQWYINLYADGGLTSVPLDSIREVQIDDAELRAEMEEALSAVEGARDKGKKPVNIQFRGDDARQVRIGYVVKAPVWKASYRLVLPDAREGTGRLQGWAIVENQTDADWKDVDLTLVSGRPVSFVQDLYTPTYVDRPVVSPTSQSPLQPAHYEEGRAPTQKQSRARDGEAGAARAEALAAGQPSEGDVAFDLSQGVEATATTADEGAFFQYQVDGVSLPRQGSAMLPIVTEPVEVERLSIYDPSMHETHPLRGARLDNTTGRHLAAGPLTVFDDGSYGGDARLTDTPPGDTRFVSYALNQDLRVDRAGGTTEQRVATGKIVGGVLTVSRKRIAERKYVIDNDGDRRATLILEHPRRAGWSLVEPQPVETTSSTYRFRTSVGAGDSNDLVVRQERVEDEETRLVDTNQDRLYYYSNQDGIPDDVRDALRKAAELRQAIATTEDKLRRAEEKRQRLRENQARIRDNLKAVDAENEYHQRLLEKLKSTESDIEDVQERIEALDTEKADRERKLKAYLQNLDVT